MSHSSHSARDRAVEIRDRLIGNTLAYIAREGLTPEGAVMAALRMGAEAALLSLAQLPTPGDGCQCTGHSQYAGGGHFEHLLEYEPSCPEHSEHVWNPRTGVWEHADCAGANEEARP